MGARVTGIETFREAARRVRTKGRNILSEPDAKRVPRSAVVMQPDTLGPASALSPPLAIKAIVPDIVHKSDVGGVRLAIPDLAAAGSAMAEMNARLGAQGYAVEGFLEFSAHGGRTQFALVLRSDGEPEVKRRKQACRLAAMRDGIPAFDDFAEAATALAALGFRLRFLARPR